MSADRRLRNDARERIPDRSVLVLRDQGDAVRDRVRHVVRDRLPRLVEERRLVELPLELVAQPSQQLEVVRFGVGGSSSVAQGEEEEVGAQVLEWMKRAAAARTSVVSG